MKKYAGFILELIVFAVLLYVVWHNTHWSVALTLTLIVLSLENSLAKIKYVKRKGGP